ncbi:ester cyclase [Allomuricauda sp. SCSIO 65647]|uniref:ester cyclase n=1 Tax=Allomuricauda sp. SCSIO 65647 TaxID=2908843 RepID=UPI001F3BE7E5|nr:ester cyclase [Muricauda sp. SCSIO 65647]UJH68799.1 ester cyclase [Muricauda sp. SCSIO 65647]
MDRKSSYLPVLMLLTLLFSCKNQTVDIEKERQNAVEEYIAKSETDRQQKLAVIEKFYGVFATGDMSVLPEILAENYTQYPADPGQTPDIEGFIKHAQDFENMFSDLKGKPSHILVDNDLVFVRSELKVTHSGKAFDIPATNRRIKITAFDLHHFNEEGKIDKTWHLEDFWGAYSQISAE